WIFNNLIILDDLIVSAPEDVRIFALNSQAPIGVTIIRSDQGRIHGSPPVAEGFYKFSCDATGDPENVVAVIPVAQGPGVLNQLSRLRRDLSAVGWTDKAWDLATLDFIRDYLKAVAARGGALN